MGPGKKRERIVWVVGVLAGLVYFPGMVAWFAFRSFWLGYAFLLLLTLWLLLRWLLLKRRASEE